MIQIYGKPIVLNILKAIGQSLNRIFCLRMVFCIVQTKKMAYD